MRQPVWLLQRIDERGDVRAGFSRSQRRADLSAHRKLP
jgi:hypothetical protein